MPEHPADPAETPFLPPSVPSAPPSPPAPPVVSPDEVATGDGPLRDLPDVPARLPADDVATRNVPRREDSTRLTADEVATRNVPESGTPAPGRDPDQTLLPGEVVATRNVPPAPAPIEMPIVAVAEEEFELPEIEPMGPATTAMLVGRVLFAVAALLIGLAARRSTGLGGSERASSFWPVVMSAGVLTLVGVVGLVFWSTMLAENASRLRARASSPRAMGLSWLFPIGWVVVSSLTYLQLEVDAEIDPLPGVAAVGWAISLTIVYGRLQGVLRGLSRRPPVVWWSAFPIDLFAFGLVWWRLTSWPSPVVGKADDIELTANIAFGAAAALAVNVLVFVWLANRAGNGLYERLGRLEALHRRDSESEPEWFRAGLAARQALPPPVVTRPLIATKHLASVVAALHVMWGVALAGFGLVLGGLAFEYADTDVFIGDELVLDDGDTDRLVLVGGIVGLLYVAAIVTHGVWAVLSAMNARRITVHSPNPGTFVIAFAPAPLLLVAGLVVGGRVGYWLVVAGLTVAFLALVLVNQMLMALSARLGGRLIGFSRWTLCLTLTYVAGIVLNVLFFRSSAQLGFYATVTLVQGVLIAVGGVIGYSAMRELEDTLRGHRQVHRIDPA